MGYYRRTVRLLVIHTGLWWLWYGKYFDEIFHLASFLILILTQFCSQIITAKNVRYRIYFGARFTLEFIKLAIVILIPILGKVLWEDIKFTDELDAEYLTFIVFASMSILFTITTTIWSSVRIRKAQITRKEN